jgi:hypothetical protein
MLSAAHPSYVVGMTEGGVMRNMKKVLLGVAVLTAISIALPVRGALTIGGIGGTVPPMSSLRVGMAGSGSGTVRETSTSGAPNTRVPTTPPRDCETDCVTSYVMGALVRLVAVPGEGSVFDGWSDGLTGEVLCDAPAACTVGMLSDRVVTATFTKLHTLTVGILAQGGLGGTGTIYSTPAGIACRFGAGMSGSCSATFSEGTFVTLRAVVDPGRSFFGGYAGDCTDRDLECSLLMMSDKHVLTKWGGGMCGSTPDKLHAQDCGGGSQSGDF